MPFTKNGHSKFIETNSGKKTSVKMEAFYIEDLYAISTCTGLSYVLTTSSDIW